MFSFVSALLLPIWKPLSDWAINASIVKVPDLHFGNAVFLEIANQIYPLVYSYLGSNLWTWLVCIPILVADLLATLLFDKEMPHFMPKNPSLFILLSSSTLSLMPSVNPATFTK